MNGLHGILCLDDQPVDQQQLQKCTYHSEKWQSDHQGVFVQDPVGFTSTQRFITEECGHAPMPYHHSESRCTIVADVYLSNRSELIAKLSMENNLADVELVLAAYLKWGHDCPKYLAGPFMFAIWNDREQTLFVAVDHFGTNPCLYSYQSDKYFTFANYMSPFRNICNTLTLNENLFAHYTLEIVPNEESCYQEVKRILPGHYIVVSKRKFLMQRYWQLKSQRRHLGYQTREEYYEAFREIFSNTITNYMRSSYPITAHISGGLDSSAVASMAAKILQEKNQTLYGFTAIPLELTGPSYRKNWRYHEMPLVQKILDQYPNIQHSIYRTSPALDSFALLSKFNHDIDQPIRNNFNFEWLIACLENTNNNSRIVLNSQRGNGTISWTGLALKTRLGVIYRGIKYWLKPQDDVYYQENHSAFLNTPRAKQILRRGSFAGLHDNMLFSQDIAARKTCSRLIRLHYGKEELDPTGDVRMTEFCYNVPQWVYYKGKNVLQQRLLVREALEGIVPEAIRMNPYRGEQAVDAYLQYNIYAGKWKNKLDQLSEEAADLLWRFYDKEKILALFNLYEKIEKPTREVMIQIYCSLMRCLTAAFYLDYLLHGKMYGYEECLINSNAEG